MDKKCRGSVMNAYLKFIKHKWGKESLEKALADMGLEDFFKDGLYYDNEVRENILRWISREKGMEHVEEGGKFVVQNLGIISWLVRFANVRTILEKFPKNYSEVYNFGRLEADFGKEGELSVRLYGVNDIEESCNAWLGVCKGTLEMTRTPGEVKEVKCRRKGDEYCEYSVKIA
ncbi:MAG: hypothetical protein QCI38_02015 [Candidatus Thermoplasmatota archaeon]|nr:hypothetical protein [Candidatus Thermoplasmatota archaeon]